MYNKTHKTLQKHPKNPQNPIQINFFENFHNAVLGSISALYNAVLGAARTALYNADIDPRTCAHNADTIKNMPNDLTAVKTIFLESAELADSGNILFSKF